MAKDAEVSHGELVQRIADACESISGKDMVALWNGMFPDQVKYLGDSMYVIESETK